MKTNSQMFQQSYKEGDKVFYVGVDNMKHEGTIVLRQGALAVQSENKSHFYTLEIIQPQQ